MRLRVVSTAASLLAVVPGVTHALGLGEIQLRSTLNAPLNAEIELTASAEELSSLRAQIASRDAFSRYGLEYPAFLANVQVKTVQLASGRNVIQLTSAAAMTEPFATILVEASWARGRVQREYTVLFDPPAFAPAQAAAPAPVAAPVAGAGDRSGSITRPATPQPAPAAAPERPAAAAPAAASAGGDYQVRSGDSLSGIARREYGTDVAEQAMIAIFRANPQAFDDNINRLRSGTVLRLPDNAAVNAISRGEAVGEVRRQAAAWAGSAAATAGSAGGADARLRLVPPDAAAGAGGTSGETQALRDQVARLETDLAETRRLLELRNAELARLQGGAATAPAAPVAPATPAPATPETPAVTEEPTAAEPATAEPAAVEPAAPAPEAPAAEEEPASPASQSTSLLDLVLKFWYIPAGVILLLLAALGLKARRRREESSDSLAPFAVAAPPAAERDTSSDTFPLRRPAIDTRDPSIVVEESGTHERPRFAPPKDARTVVDLEDAASSMSVPALDATAAMDQADPLAEADFHMAYGLYDQAADLVKLAMQREPSRRDLKLKLLEVFFVWGNKDQFLQTARELADTRDSAAPGEWEKIVIMGKQLAPDDALFSQSYSGVGPASVDLNLEGGQNLVDFDLQGEPSVSLNSDGSVDMSLSGAPGSQTAALDGLSGLDFMLDDPSRGDELARTATTRQMVQPGYGDAGAELAPTARVAIDGPTVEQPALDVGDTLVGKLDAQSNFGISSDQTAELALDDLGLDLGKLEGTGTNLLDDSRLVRALDSPDAPTLVAGLDETSRRMIEGDADANQPTELLPLAEFEADTGATTRVASLDFELDLDGNAETGKRSALTETDFNLDLDVGAPEHPVDGEYQRTQRIDPVAVTAPGSSLTEKDLEPVTMSEVGTKLDLARAYMDMGDPDGARSILNEVLQEGSSSQRQEAQRLLDSIPG